MVAGPVNAERCVASEGKQQSDNNETVQVKHHSLRGGGKGRLLVSLHNNKIIINII